MIDEPLAGLRNRPILMLGFDGMRHKSPLPPCCDSTNSMTVIIIPRRSRRRFGFGATQPTRWIIFAAWEVFTASCEALQSKHTRSSLVAASPASTLSTVHTSIEGDWHWGKTTSSTSFFSSIFRFDMMLQSKDPRARRETCPDHS